MPVRPQTVDLPSDYDRADVVDQLRAWSDSMTDAAPASRSRRLAAARSLLAYAAQVGMIASDPSRALRVAKPTQLAPERILSERDVARIILARIVQHRQRRLNARPLDSRMDSPADHRSAHLRRMPARRLCPRTQIVQMRIERLAARPVAVRVRRQTGRRYRPVAGLDAAAFMRPLDQPHSTTPRREHVATGRHDPASSPSTARASQPSHHIAKASQPAVVPRQISHDQAPRKPAASASHNQ